MAEPRGADDDDAAAVGDLPQAGDRAERAQLLSPQALYGLQPLDLRARVIADGVLHGEHRSKRFGASQEFAEHKLYAPGDDLRRLDWRAYARMDRYFVRRYEAETNLEVAIVVDTSESMAYAGGARGAFSVQKLEAARTLAAALAWIAVHRADAPSLALFAGDERAFLPARARTSQLSSVIDALVGCQPSGKTALRDQLVRVGDRLTRRAFVVVISDLIDCGPQALEPLGVLRRMGCDALVLHTLDRDELELPFDGVVRFEDMEGDRVVQVDAPLVRDAYLAELARFLDEIRGACARHDLRYALAPTDRSPVHVLAEALAGTAAAKAGPR